MARTTEGTIIEAVRNTAHPLAELVPDYEPLLRRIGDARFVLLGEASHGTHEFYQFDAVLHFDETRAVEPLERAAEWDAGEVPETFPFAV